MLSLKPLYEVSKSKSFKVFKAAGVFNVVKFVKGFKMLKHLIFSMFVVYGILD